MGPDRAAVTVPSARPVAVVSGALSTSAVTIGARLPTAVVLVQPVASVDVPASVEVAPPRPETNVAAIVATTAPKAAVRAQASRDRAGPVV